MASESKTKAAKLTIHLSDEATLKAVKTVLAYESSVRGRTIGQVSSDLVSEAADIEHYPKEVRDRLAQINAESAQRAIERSLSMSKTSV